MSTSVTPFTGPSRASTSSWSKFLGDYLVHGVSTGRRVWVATQVSHRGEYSIERLLALEEYMRKTSLTRDLLVCAGTPLPIIFLVILQEALPLENPASGWRANWGFWIRAGLLGGMASLAIFSQLETFISNVKLSVNQLVGQFVFMAIGHSAASILVAALLAFPIPYMVIAMSPPFLVLFVGSMRVVLGGRVFHSILENRHELKRFVNAVSVQVLMAVVYPAYQVFFNSVAGSLYELPAFMLLPVIKFVLKHLVAFSLAELPELIPHNIIFTVHFFNALYLATCMQSASSNLAVALIMTIDFLETGLTLLSIYRSTTRTMKQLHETIGPTSKTATLLDAAFSLCHYHNKFTKEERNQIQAHSILQHQLSSKSREILAKIDNSALNLGPTFHRASNTQSMQTMKTAGVATSDPSRFRAVFSHNWGAKIDPVVPIKEIHVKKLVHAEHAYNLQAVAAVPSALHMTSLRKSLATLFTIECMVLAEYVEFIIPVLYGSYVLMMVHLPSAKYHTELTGLTRENVESTVRTIFIYGMLELGSFILLVVLMKRSCGMQALHHLAFVLENEVLSIQSKMIGWMLMTLGFRILHFGVDFTFQFSWIRDHYS